MKKRLLSLLCVLALCLGLLPGTAWAAEEVFYVAYSWNEDTSTLTSETKSVTDYTALSGSISTTTWSDGWYVVSDNATNTGRSNIKVSGTVNLILTSGKTLTLNGPNISLQDSSAVLNIYGQAGNTGKLSITAGNSSGDAGINLNGGTLNIHGGTVTATGYTTSATKSAPGIDVGTSTLTVYGGEVTAEAGTYSSAGYGAGIRVVTDGTVNIHGGTVTATGASFVSTNDSPGAGIGGSGSNGETCGTVTITGGTVTANGGDGYQQHAAAGIGGGAGKSSSAGGGGNVTITGGTVTANGGKASRNDNVQAPGIGGAVYLSSTGDAGTFSTGTNGSAVITTTGGIQAGTSGCSAIIDNTVYGTVTLPDSLKTLNKDLTVPSGATLILPDGTTTRGAITVNGTLTVDSGSTVTNTGTITVESGGTLTGTGTIHNTDSGKVTNNGTNDKVTITYPSTVTVTSEPSGTAGPNQSVTFTATVTGNDTAGTPTGTVQFKDGETNLGEAVALEDGAATYTAANGLDIGEHPITAEYIPADGSSYQGSTSSALTFTVVGEVESISIKTPPTTMTYTTGDALNLSGLVITVHYDGTNYTSEVTWGQDSGITASIDDEPVTTLYASQHDGKTVTITYEEKSATTDGTLTVSKATPTVAAPTASTLTYNGTPQSLVSEGTTSGGEMQYSTEKNGNYSTAIPTGTDAGQYTVYYKVVGGGDYNDTQPTFVSVTIDKAAATVTTAPQAVEALAFTGQPQNLVTAGSANGGTLVYSLDENGEYAETIPTGTETKTYIVYYKVLGDKNHNDTTAQSVSVSIGKAAAMVTKAPDARELTYTGDPQELVTEGTANGGEIQYSLSKDSGYSATVPTGTVADDYSVWYYVKGDDNHSDTDPVQVEVTIKKADPDVTVPDGLTATYGDTLANVDLTDGWAWDAPNTSVGDVGENTFSATFTPSDTANYNTVTENLTVTVSAKDITGAVITLGDSLTYTGQEQTQQITGITVDGLTVTCTVTGNTGTDAGDYNLTITGTGNFTGTATKEWSIAKANYTGTTGVSGTVLANWSDKVTLPTIPAGASYGAASYGGKDGAVKDLSIESGVLHYTGGDNITVDQTYKITVPVDGGKNYEDYTITVTLTGTDKRVLTITGVTAQGGTYNGQTQAGYTGTPSAEGYDGGFTVTYNTADGLAPADAGTYTVTIAIPEDNAQYVGSMDLQFTIAPKALTVSVPSPSVYVGGSAPELALTYTGLVDGERVTPSEDPVVTITKSDGTEITLEDAVKTAGTYTITWSNAGDTTFLDGANYAIQTETTGTLTVSARSSGGSSSSNITTEITKNPDSSTTTTVTNKNTGTVTETTKFPDGSKQVVETKKDGTVTTTTTDTAGNKTEVVENTDGSSKTTVDNKDGSGSVTLVDENGQVVSEATLSQSAVAAAQEKGEAVALPMPEVPITTDRETAPTVTVDLPVGGSVKVEIPVEDVTAGTVAVLVKSNGDEEIIKTSVTTGNGVTVTLNNGDTVKIVDNSRDFADVPDNYWGAEAVDFAVSRELFAGTSATTFAPDTAMTRAMIVTVLARFEGVDTATGSTWYEAGQQWAMENGVSDGTNLDGSLTREQLATMLYRYAQSAGIDTAQGGMAIREYADFEQISGYAAEAMTWAVNTGIINGTSSTTLSPQGPATRAQVATILMRFIEGMA